MVQCSIVNTCLTECWPVCCSHVPEITNMPPDDYSVALQVMGGAHNVLCLLVVISYFVCNHPRMPDPREFASVCK